MGSPSHVARRQGQDVQIFQSQIGISSSGIFDGPVVEVGYDVSKSGGVDIHIGDLVFVSKSVEGCEHFLGSSQGEGGNQDISVSLDDFGNRPGKVLYHIFASVVFGTGIGAQCGFGNQDIYEAFRIFGTRENFLFVVGRVACIENGGFRPLDPDARGAQDVSGVKKLCL